MRKTLPVPTLVLLAVSAHLNASVLSFQGNFATDDQVQLFSFNLAAPETVIIETFGYAGGTNGNGTAIPEGGFDPVVTLFDSTGNFLNSNDDGPCGKVGHDAITSNCFDSYLLQSLGAGSYQVALTENDNLAIGPTLADGFTHVGDGNFTCPEFLGVSGGFCDASPSHRNNAFALDIVIPGPTSGVPEPNSALLILPFTIALLVARRYLISREVR